MSNFSLLGYQQSILHFCKLKGLMHTKIALQKKNCSVEIPHV